MFTSFKLQNFFNVAYWQQQIFLRTPFCTSWTQLVQCWVFYLLFSGSYSFYLLLLFLPLVTLPSPLQGKSITRKSVPIDFIWPHAHLKITIPYMAQNIKGGRNHEVQSTGLDFPIPGKLTAAQSENSAQFTVISNEYILLWLELQKILKIWFCFNYF